MKETEKNISGISENLADSISEQMSIEKKPTEEGKLFGKRIAISVSECEDFEQLGLSEQHLKDISIEIARYLIVNGATMLYGGDLRRGGFTELFSELSYQYKYLRDKRPRFVNYFPFPIFKSILINDRAELLKKQVEIKIIDVPKHLGEIDTERKYDPSNCTEDRYIVAECLRDMRIQMANDSVARIILGGKHKGFIGYLPGIVEETYHSLKAGKAVYLLGGFGGATKSIIDILLGKNPIELSNDFQFDSEAMREFRDYAKDKSEVKLDYDIIFDFFKQHSIETISKKNGLTIEENMILFESQNIHELVFLIIKGLQNISLNLK
jgi:hypothetical protein